MYNETVRAHTFMGGETTLRLVCGTEGKEETFLSGETVKFKGRTKVFLELYSRNFSINQEIPVFVDMSFSKPVFSVVNCEILKHAEVRIAIMKLFKGYRCIFVPEYNPSIEDLCVAAKKRLSWFIDDIVESHLKEMKI